VASHQSIQEETSELVLSNSMAIHDPGIGMLNGPVRTIRPWFGPRTGLRTDF
jgi:hypothetical protein